LRFTLLAADLVGGEEAPAGDTRVGPVFPGREADALTGGHGVTVRTAFIPIPA